jgi:hypothetical protein
MEEKNNDVEIEAFPVEVYDIDKLTNLLAQLELTDAAVSVELCHISGQARQLHTEIGHDNGVDVADRLLYLGLSRFTSEQETRFGTSGYHLLVQSKQNIDMYLSKLLSKLSQQLVGLEIWVTGSLYKEMNYTINCAQLPRLIVFNTNAAAIPIAPELVTYTLRHNHYRQVHEMELEVLIVKLAALSKLDDVSLIADVPMSLLDSLAKVKVNQLFFWTEPHNWSECLVKLPGVAKLELSAFISRYQPVLTHYPDGELELCIQGEFLDDEIDFPDLPLFSLILRLWKPCDAGMEKVIRRYAANLCKLTIDSHNGANVLVDTLLADKVLSDRIEIIVK